MTVRAAKNDRESENGCRILDIYVEKNVCNHCGAFFAVNMHFKRPFYLPEAAAISPKFAVRGPLLLTSRMTTIHVATVFEEQVPIPWNFS